jgi:hypothetical protein
MLLGWSCCQALALLAEGGVGDVVEAFGASLSSSVADRLLNIACFMLRSRTLYNPAIAREKTAG